MTAGRRAVRPEPKVIHASAGAAAGPVALQIVFALLHIHPGPALAGAAYHAVAGMLAAFAAGWRASHQHRAPDGTRRTIADVWLPQGSRHIQVTVTPDAGGTADQLNQLAREARQHGRALPEDTPP